MRCGSRAYCCNHIFMAVNHVVVDLIFQNHDKQRQTPKIQSAAILGFSYFSGPAHTLYPVRIYIYMRCSLGYPISNYYYYSKLYAQ